jgi:Chromo (CHRromatin Organisation MOdifier) domain
MLRLYKGYTIHLPTPKKLSVQYLGLFKVLERTGKLVCKLDLPTHWKIYLVVSIVHLGPATKDPFNRTPTKPPGPVKEGDGWEEYEVEKIVDKKVSADGIRYRVRWLGYGPELDWWMHDDLSDAREVIADFEALQRGLPATYIIKVV